MAAGAVDGIGCDDGDDEVILMLLRRFAMSSDNASSAVTYTSVSSDSNGPSSWGIPLVNAGEIPEMDPYEEVAQQGQAHPLSPAYVPDPMELDEHVPVYVLEPEHPEYHAPSYDDIQVEDQPYAYDASSADESPGYIADSDSIEEDTDAESIDYPDEPEDVEEDGEEDDDEDPEEDPSEEHEPEDDDDDDDTYDEDEDPNENEEEGEYLAPADSYVVHVVDHVPSAGDTEAFETDESAPTPRSPRLGAVMIRMRDDIPYEDMPPQRRFVLTAPPPGCDVAESSAAAARAPRRQYDFVDTVKAGQSLIRSPGHDARTIARAADKAEDVGYVRALQASEHRIMTSIKEVNLRVNYQAQIRMKESEDFYIHLLDARTDCRDIRLKIDVVRETHMSHMEWQRQRAEDDAVRQIMRTQVLEARARIDTVEDAGIIQNGDFYYEVEDSETKLMKETPYELLEDDQKKKLGKNNEAKMTLYNALPRKEYERVFMGKTAKEVWHTLIITYQGNSQVKKCKIDLRANVTTIEEAKDLATLPLDELVRNLKVNEMILENNDVVSKITTKEKVKSLALKAKVTRDQTSNDSDSQDRSDEDVDEEEAEAFNLLARNFCRDNSFENTGGESSKKKGACYNCGIEGHFASECRKSKEKKSFMGGAWRDSKDGDEHQMTQHEIEELLKFNKDFAKTFEKLLNEKRSLEKENSKLSSKINDLQFELKKPANDKEVCLKCDLLPDDWIVDSGCTKHMTGNRRLFTSYKAFDGGHAIFGSNLKGKVVGGGQLCDDDCVVRFTKVDFTISKDGKMLAKGHRRNGLYTCKLGDNSKQQIRLACVMDNSTLWHRSLSEPKSSSLVDDVDETIVQDLMGRVLQVYVLATATKSLTSDRGNPIEQDLGELNERTLRSKTKQA
ncbi:putative reverse transcriptase domain-containing protein [Tanacetum coccineum]|uniref:Reverse transcriptase domain-containing protein n=1 Tax=Tanacetum coccineum TaxID=301880 RepID=A0ABQ5HPL0_9ASTR